MGVDLPVLRFCILHSANVRLTRSRTVHYVQTAIDPRAYMLIAYPC